MEDDNIIHWKRRSTSMNSTLSSGCTKGA